MIEFREQKFFVHDKERPVGAQYLRQGQRPWYMIYRKTLSGSAWRAAKPLATRNQKKRE